MSHPPAFEKSLLVTDDAVLAARVSSLFRQRGRYFSVLDGPRMTRPDADNEVTRRRNAMVMTGARWIILGRLPPDSVDVMRPGWQHCTISDDFEEVTHALRGYLKRPRGVLHWGREDLGVGLYRARLEGKELKTNLDSSPRQSFVEAGSNLLVVCERGDDLAEVVASNLAFACGASFAMFPELAEDLREQWLEELYALGDGRNLTARFSDLAQRARSHLGTLDVAKFKTVLFVTAGFPWSIAFSDKAASHMYRYPDFGRAVVEGLWASQAAARTSRTALLVDPQRVDGSEIAAINRSLLRNGTLTRVATGRAATTAKIQFLLDLVPFDVIVLSSHAGDAPGERITYEYPDADGKQRRLTVDRALGISYDRVEDMFRVIEYHRFHELDEVDWRDRAGKAALPVGSAITAWIALGGASDRDVFIAEREPIPRVIGSMAIQMHDGPWLFASHGFPPEAAPLIVNNSCWSWHELSRRTTFAGARGYIGTLVPVTDAEAQDVGRTLFDRLIGRNLATALSLAQREIYGDSPRRPYVMVGLPFVSVRANTADSVSFLTNSYLRAIAHWSERARNSPHQDVRKNADRFVTFLMDDLKSFRVNLKAGHLRRR